MRDEKEERKKQACTYMYMVLIRDSGIPTQLSNVFMSQFNLINLFRPGKLVKVLINYIDYTNMHIFNCFLLIQVLFPATTLPKNT